MAASEPFQPSFPPLCLIVNAVGTEKIKCSLLLAQMADLAKDYKP